MTDVKRAAMASSLMATLASSSTIIQSIEESDINDLHGELALGQRIVTAAEHDRKLLQIDRTNHGTKYDSLNMSHTSNLS